MYTPLKNQSKNQFSMKLKEGECYQNRNGCYGNGDQESDGVPASILMRVVQVMVIRIGVRMVYSDAFEKKSFFFGGCYQIATYHSMLNLSKNSSLFKSSSSQCAS